MFIIKFRKKPYSEYSQRIHVDKSIIHVRIYTYI